MGKYLNMLRSSQGYEKHEINEKAVRDDETHGNAVTKKEVTLDIAPDSQSNFVPPQVVEEPSCTAFSLISLISLISYYREENINLRRFKLERLLNSGNYEGKNYELVKHYLGLWRCGDANALDPLLAYLERKDVQQLLWTVN